MKKPPAMPRPGASFTLSPLKAPAVAKPAPAAKPAAKPSAAASAPPVKAAAAKGAGKKARKRALAEDDEEEEEVEVDEESAEEAGKGRRQRDETFQPSPKEQRGAGAGRTPRTRNAAVQVTDAIDLCVSSDDEADAAGEGGARQAVQDKTGANLKLKPKWIQVAEGEKLAFPEAVSRRQASALDHTYKRLEAGEQGPRDEAHVDFHAHTVELFVPTESRPDEVARAHIPYERIRQIWVRPRRTRTTPPH